MIIYEKFSAQRMILARECAEALGLKEIPAALYNFAINVSELPERTDMGDVVSPSIEESTLLSMGLVYSYHGTLTFINTDGHTMVMPNCDILKDELRKCGYLICEYGKSTPILGSADKDSFEYRRELADCRKKYTLPDHLVERVLKQENSVMLEKHEEYPYDVFSDDYYRGGLCDGVYSKSALTKLDLTSKSARKLMAIFYGSPSLTHPGEGVRNLEDYLLHASQQDALCDRRYYSDDGLFEAFSKQQKAIEEARQRRAASSGSVETGLDANGNLTDVSDEIVSDKTVLPGTPVKR